MKKSITFLIVCVITMFCACTQNEIIENEEITEINSKRLLRKAKKHPLAPDIEKNQIVIQYINKAIDKEDIKSFLENKYFFKVKEGGVRTCDCDDDSIELWTINISNPKFGGVETLIGGHDTNSDDIADLNADFQFSLFVKEGDQSLVGNYTKPIEQMVHTNSSEDRVNIAVIDTGIDYDYFDARFLYNPSGDASNCLGKEISGWDFVNNDNDPRDNHGHGTFVTAIIRDILTQENIPYQILPVKAFNKDGKGTYFDILCGLQYIASKQKPFLVNCSFGFYNLKNQVIFENIVESNSNNLLLMASAGNDEIDTDARGNEHFPSSYKSENLLAIGGYIGDFFAAPYIGVQYISGFNLAPKSNYGNTSIDVVASFEYDLTLKRAGKTITFPIKGTSFSCPIITARAAAVYFKNPISPRGLKYSIISTSFKNSSLRDKIKNSNIIVEGYYRMPNPIGPSPINPR